MRVTGDHGESMTERVQRGHRSTGRREIGDPELRDFLLSFAEKASRDGGGSWLGKWSQNMFLQKEK